MAIARGCGTRVAGGLYLETKLADRGNPVEHYLMDPVTPFPAAHYPLAPIGVSLVQHPKSQAFNVLDWVGGGDYPNVADFVEEVRRYGISRRIASTQAIGKLTQQSRLLLVHGRAFIANVDDYGEASRPCLKTYSGHKPGTYRERRPTMCAAAWWDDLTDGLTGERNRQVIRSMPSFQYIGQRRPDGVRPSYSPAIFAAFPIGQLTVIKDPAGSHEKTLRAAEKASLWLPIVLEEE